MATGLLGRHGRPLHSDRQCRDLSGVRMLVLRVRVCVFILLYSCIHVMSHLFFLVIACSSNFYLFACASG